VLGDLGDPQILIYRGQREFGRGDKAGLESGTDFLSGQLIRNDAELFQHTRGIAEAAHRKALEVPGTLDRFAEPASSFSGKDAAI
jgi:hypothetical protein